MADTSKFDLIPLELRRQDQWVCWKVVPKKDGKTDKIPINPHTGKEAKSNDRDTWGSFRDCVLYHQKHPKAVAGVGFVFSELDPFCGVDLDDCVTTEGITQKATEILDAVRSYCEISPSGKGTYR